MCHKEKWVSSAAKQKRCTFYIFSVQSNSAYHLETETVLKMPGFKFKRKSWWEPRGNMLKKVRIGNQLPIQDHRSNLASVMQLTWGRTVMLHVLVCVWGSVNVDRLRIIVPVKVHLHWFLEFAMRNYLYFHCYVFFTDVFCLIRMEHYGPSLGLLCLSSL